MTEVGAIVRALQNAQEDRLLAERLCEELIASCLPDFRPVFPRSRCWEWTEPAGLDVWEVLGSPSAVTCLGRGGFKVIRLHDHSRGNDRCACPTRNV